MQAGVKLGEKFQSDPLGIRYSISVELRSTSIAYSIHRQPITDCNNMSVA